MYYAVGIGPGGAELLLEGSETMPRMIGEPGTEEAPGTTGGLDSDGSSGEEVEGERERRAWPWAARDSCFEQASSERSGTGNWVKGPVRDADIHHVPVLDSGGSL